MTSIWRSSFTCFPGARPGRNGDRRPGFHAAPGWRASSFLAFHRASRFAWRGRLSSASFSERMRRSREWGCPWDHPGLERGWPAETPGRRGRKQKCAVAPAPCPSSRSNPPPSRSPPAQNSSADRSARKRKALLFFFQSLLQLVSQPGRKSALRAEPQLHDNADGGDDDEPPDG